jgi:hypothetical protein
VTADVGVAVALAEPDTGIVMLEAVAVVEALSLSLCRCVLAAEYDGIGELLQDMCRTSSEGASCEMPLNYHTLLELWNLE